MRGSADRLGAASGAGLRYLYCPVSVIDAFRLRGPPRSAGSA